MIGWEMKITIDMSRQSYNLCARTAAESRVLLLNWSPTIIFVGHKSLPSVVLELMPVVCFGRWCAGWRGRAGRSLARLDPRRSPMKRGRVEVSRALAGRAARSAYGCQASAGAVGDTGSVRLQAVAIIRAVLGNDCRDTPPCELRGIANEGWSTVSAMKGADF